MLNQKKKGGGSMASLPQRTRYGTHPLDGVTEKVHVLFMEVKTFGFHC